MKKTAFATILIAFLLPVMALADSYTSLWKQYDAAVSKDHPRTQIKVLGEIITKATHEKAYGQLLKAQVASAQAITAISPDSLDPAVKRIEAAEAEAEQSGNKVLAAVYASALGTVYQQNPSLAPDAEEKSRAFFRKSLANPDVLSNTYTTAYEPFVIDGVDSRFFYDDMLHVIAIAAGDFNTLHDYYASHNLREGACLTALMKIKQKRDYGVTKVKKSKYMQSLDSLITEYADLPVAGELAIERYSFMSDAEDITAEDKMNYLNYALLKWGAWPRMNILRNAQRKLTLPMFHVSIGKTMLTEGQKRNVVVMSACNIGELKMMVSRINADGTTQLDPSNQKDYEKLRRSIDPAFTPQTDIRRYFGKADYEVSRDTLVIQPLSAGMYLVEFTTNNVNIAPERALLNVSRLYPLTESLPGNKIRVAVLDATTGEPVPEAVVEVITGYTNDKPDIKKYTCNADGEVCITYSGRAPESFRVCTATDKAFPFTRMNTRFYYFSARPVTKTTSLHTDRSIYRPGQTVHVAAIAYDYDSKTLEAEAVSGRQITLTLRDANRKEVARHSVVTDEFGMATTDFVLPQNVLSGLFTVSADYGNVMYSAFSVEEYKRPTFTVEFDKLNTKYQNGDTVTVKGVAKSYAGVAVQGAKVVVKATRRPSMLWRYAAGEARSETVLNDTITTSTDGTFSMRVPMVLPETEEEHPQRYYRIDIEAAVTDGAGETKLGSASIPLSDRPTLLSCDLPKKSLRDSLKTIRFDYRNNAGEEIDGDVTYFIDNQRRTCKANTEVKIDASQLASAQHTLTAYCGNDTISRNFVVFSLQDRKVAIDTHDWFYVSATQFPRDGSPVYVQVGSSDSVQHVVYTMMSGDRIISEGNINLHNSLKTKAISYREDFGDGVVLSVAWVKEGVAYRHTARITRPMPDTRLNMKWTTFRDRLTPGQKETWTLNITNPDGTPAKAQLLATLYDKSLDALRLHSMTMALPSYSFVPYLAWDESYIPLQTRFGEMPVKFLEERELDLSRFNEIRIWRGNYMPPYGEVLCAKEEMKGRSNAIKLKSDKAFAKMESADALSAVETMADRSGNDAGAETDDHSSAATAQLRENLNETAFFFPGLTTDDKGNVSMKFTLPESVTTWQFYGLAHDRNMNNGTLSAEAVAQKTVMVQPNMPRFVRSNDKGTLQVRIANTSEKNVNGTARMVLINPETDKEVYKKDVKFSVKANETTVADFPFDMKSVSNDGLLICRITASGHAFSDGEQHYLPVLSDKELVTNTVAFTQNGAGTTVIDLEPLFPVKSNTNRLTVEYTNNPAWLMVQALPSVASTDREDAISLATSFYANSIGRSIMASSESIRKVVELWKNEKNDETSLQSSLEKNRELKQMVLEETPWLLQAERESEQKRMLASFFDESLIDYRCADAVSKLQRLQSNDGSFVWWKGMNSSPYITVSVLTTLVRLNAMIGNQQQTRLITDRAFAYLAKEVAREVTNLKKLEAKGSKNLRPSDMALNYLYACALAHRKLSASEKSNNSYLINLAAQQNGAYSIYEKAMSAVIMAQYQHTEEANDLLQSLKEYTVYSEETGRYFDTNKAQYSWYDYRIPSQVAAIEALQLLNPDDKQTISEMQRWLLQSKRTQSWDTPVNSVNAIYAFLKNNSQTIAGTDAPLTTLKLNGSKLQTPKATAGLGYVKTAKTGSDMKSFTVEKATDGVSWGAVYAQFMQPLADIEASQSGLTVTRQFIIDGKPLAGDDLTISKGDRVTVRITIRAERDYDFVQVTDKREACLEPAQQLSGYIHGYYCTPKDNATYYYFDRFAKGTHTIETTYYADRSGTYHSGVCTVQCAYSPEYSARAAASVITVK